MFTIIAIIETGAGSTSITWEDQDADMIAERRDHVDFLAPLGSTITFIVKPI
jgi:hypothetical protein